MAQALEGIALSVFLQYIYVAVSVSVLFAVFFFLKKKSSIRPFLLAWFLGAFAFNFFSLSWLYSAYPIIWLPERWQLLAITALLFLMALAASVPFLLSGYAHFRARSASSFLPLAIFFAVSISEALRSISLSALFYEEKSATLGLHWSAGTFGNALSLTPLVEYAHVGGVFVLSGILAMLISLFFGPKKRIVVLYVSAIVIGWGIIHFALPVKTIHKEGVFGVVQLRSGKEDSLLAFKKQTDEIMSLAQSATTSIDMLILPEDARFIDALEQKDKEALKKIGIETIIDGATTIHRDKLSNYSYAYAVDSDVLQGRGKWFMFPFNEYMPSSFSWLARFWFSKEEIAEHSKSHSYALGKVPQVFDTPYGGAGALICSEMFSHEAIQALRKENLSFVVLQSHLPVFHRSPWLFMSYYLIARTIAAQTRSYLFVSSTDAPALIVSPYGKILFRGDLSSSLYLFRVDSERIVKIK